MQQAVSVVSVLSARVLGVIGISAFMMKSTLRVYNRLAEIPLARPVAQPLVASLARRRANSSKSSPVDSRIAGAP